MVSESKDPTRLSGVGAKFAGATVEYVGPGSQHNGVIPVPGREPVKGVTGTPGVATGRLVKGRPRQVSPMAAAAAAAAAADGKPFIVRDAKGNIIAQP